MGWFEGACVFNANLRDALLLQIKMQTPIGDVPVLKNLVSDREAAVEERYNEVGVQLAQVVLSAGHEFSTEQCGPVKFASQLFQIVPLGNVGVFPPNPRMSSRPIYTDIEKNDPPPPRPKKRNYSACHSKNTSVSTYETGLAWSYRDSF